MAGLGTGFAVLAFADQCLKYGNIFVEKCKNYLHAEEEATELLVAIESNWLKVGTQIQILKRIAPVLNKDLRDSQAQVLSQLEGKLKSASLVIEQLKDRKRKARKHDERGIKGSDGMKMFQKAKYAIKKDHLYTILDDIEKWQTRYDPTWILIMQMSIGNIDNELEEKQKDPEHKQIPIITAAKGIRDAVRKSRDSNVKDMKSIWIETNEIHLNPILISNSIVEISTLLPDAKEMVIIDTMVCGSSADIESTTKEVRDLARILAEVDPSTFGLLKCRGVVKSLTSTLLNSLISFKFIFSIPCHLSHPRSLRTVLLSTTLYPLDERLALAKKLTSSILFVHTVQFVHKNIRPETIIIFQNDLSEIGAPFLAGFEQFRLDSGLTNRIGDDIWYHNLYRHPTRQGIHPEVSYQMQHDIYSLGVVLLEIGLWTSFVLPPVQNEGQNHIPPLPNTIISPPNATKVKNLLGNAIANKKTLEQLAERELPYRLGRRYAEIVLQCLRCLDPGTGIEEDGKGFGVGIGIDDTQKEFLDEDGIVIGVRFIENVLEKMQDITI